MASKGLTSVLKSSRLSQSCLPPTFLLPLRQNLSSVSTTTHTTDPEPPPGSYIPTSHSEPPKVPVSGTSSVLKSDFRPRHPQLSRKTPLPPPIKPLSSSLPLLQSLASQPPHYILSHIHARPYLLTEGDSVRLPFHMPNAPPGTIIRLNRASMLGSRDFTFRGEPWIDEQYFSCRAVVTSVDKEPERVKVKKKQRNRRKKVVRSQMRLTTLRVMELKVLPQQSIANEKGDAEQKQTLSSIRDNLVGGTQS